MQMYYLRIFSKPIYSSPLMPFCTKPQKLFSPRCGLRSRTRPFRRGILWFVPGGEREGSASSRREPAGLLQRFRRSSGAHQNLLRPESFVRGSFFPMQRCSSGERRDGRGDTWKANSSPPLLQPRPHGGRGHAGADPGRRSTHLPNGGLGGGSPSHLAARAQRGRRALGGLLPLLVSVSALFFVSRLFVVPHPRGPESTLVVLARRRVPTAVPLAAGFADRSEHVLPGLSLPPGAGTQHGGSAGRRGSQKTDQERPAPNSHLHQQLRAGVPQNPLHLPEHSAAAVHAVHHSDAAGRVGPRQQREGKRKPFSQTCRIICLICDLDRNEAQMTFRRRNTHTHTRASHLDWKNDPPAMMKYFKHEMSFVCL